MMSIRYKLLQRSWLLWLLCPIPAFAEVNIADTLINIQYQMPAFRILLTGFSYLTGFGLVLSALFHLRKYGEMRTMMAANADLKGPIIKLIIGACFIELPLLLRIMLDTLFGISNPIAYPPSNNEMWDRLAHTLIIIVQFIGAVNMMKGLFMLNKVGSGQAQQESLGKAVIHIIGATLCLNAYGTMNILFTTLGIFS